MDSSIQQGWLLKTSYRETRELATNAGEFVLNLYAIENYKSITRGADKMGFMGLIPACVKYI